MTPIERVREALNLAIADTDSSVVRELLRKARRELDGKVLVPVEPIGPMIMYGIHAHEKNDDLPDIGLGPKCVGIYRAMIAPYVEGRRQ